MTTAAATHAQAALDYALAIFHTRNDHGEARDIVAETIQWARAARNAANRNDETAALAARASARDLYCDVTGR